MIKTFRSNNWRSINSHILINNKKETIIHTNKVFRYNYKKIIISYSINGKQEFVGYGETLREAFLELRKKVSK